MFALLSIFFNIVIGSTVLLTPKNHLHNFLNIDSFATEHQMTTLASFDDLTIYKMNQEHYYLYSNTLDDLFYVEREQRFTINDNEHMNFTLMFESELLQSEMSIPWHLDRISKTDLPLNGTYPYNDKGSCHQNPDLDIHTYVIDTGIDVNHPEFEGRATWLANFVDKENTDCNSHGTHCAGLVGSKSYGVCKDANLFAVKVLSCDGSGSTSSVIQGIEFAYKRHLEQSKNSKRTVKSIVSMSLGGGKSMALNKAVKSTIRNNNFYFAAAAGNEMADSCNTSPAGVKEIFTVMASDRNDKRAYFSNYGKCADIYSPGVNILSTIPNNKNAVYSGTSMATPIFVGVLNHYIDLNKDLDMKNLKQKILKESNQNKISDNQKDTNNVLAYLNRN